MKNVELNSNVYHISLILKLEFCPNRPRTKLHGAKWDTLKFIVILMFFVILSIQTITDLNKITVKV
jgi:hypothetical protein